MTYTHLSLEGPIATVSLHHPEGNRISLGMREELLEAFRRIAESDCRVLLVRADGPNFCMGDDVRDWPDVEPKHLRPRIETLAEALNHLEKLSIPSVAAVQGHCLGGGWELVLSCDLVVVGQSAVFGFPETLLGITTLQGGVLQLAQRLGRSRALEFALLGDMHSAADMERLNLVNRVVADDQLEDAAGAIVDRLAAGPPRAYAATKLLLRAWAAGGVNAAQSVLHDLSMPLFEQEEVRTALLDAAAAITDGRRVSGRVFDAGPTKTR